MKNGDGGEGSKRRGVRKGERGTEIGGEERKKAREEKSGVTRPEREEEREEKK